MKIPIPCKFGEYAECKNRMLPFEGVSWFKWTQGMEYTYFFTVNNSWSPSDFYTTFQDKQDQHIDIPDVFLTDNFVKDKGFPLKGRGYANGVYFKKGNLYVDFILTDKFFAHVKVQCDKQCNYIPGGDIIFPTGWDDQAKERILLKSFKKNKPS